MWSAELPTKSGWYWVHSTKWPTELEIVEVRMVRGERYIRCTEGELDMSLTWLWSGPLEPPPREPT